MDKNNQYFKKNENEFREYGLELEGLANNLDNNKIVTLICDDLIVW